MKEVRFNMPAAQPAQAKKTVTGQKGSAPRRPQPPKKKRRRPAPQKSGWPQENTPAERPVASKRKRQPPEKNIGKKAAASKREVAPKVQQPKPKRRITAAETKRRRLRGKIFKIFLITLLIVLGVYASVALVFKIEKFEVQGSSRYRTEEIIAAFGHKQDESIFAFHIGGEEKKMMQMLPYLETIKVRRRMPDTVVFIVEPAEETYAVQAAEGYVVLSENKKILRTAPSRPIGLCEILGTKAKTSTVGTLFEAETLEQQQLLDELLPLLRESEIKDIRQLDISDPFDLKFTAWKGDIQVLLGTSVKLEHKLRTVDKLLTQEIPAGSKGVLDASAAPTTGKTIFRQGDTK